MERFYKNKIVFLSTIICMLIITSPAMGASFTQLYPCLKNLNGWKADPPTGANVQLPDMHLVTATRSYQKGKQLITALIMIGPQALASWLPYAEGFQLDTPDESVSTKTVNNFPIQIIYDKKNHSGAILVELSSQEDKDTKKAAAFHISFTSMKPEEALKIAEKFDWKEIQKKVNDLLK